MLRLMGKRAKWTVAAVAVVVVASGAGYAMTASDHGTGKAPAGSATGLPKATAPVTRGDLGSGVSVDGTLGYAKERKLNAVGSPGTGAGDATPSPAPSGSAGTGGTGTGTAPGPAILTWTAENGATLERDGKLYEVNGHPVRLFYGTTPAYRALKQGDKGEDVKQLKRNLQALGFGTGLDASDGTFTTGTTTAVKRWQKSHDAKQTGEIALGDIAFASGPQRVQKNDMAVGDEAASGKPVLTLTGTERMVHLQLDAAKAATIKTGDAVSVRTSDGKTANGTVDSVGATADTGSEAGAASGGGGGGDKKPKITVEITLDNAGSLKGPDRAPVSVNLPGPVRKDVLSVPVNALLALSGGGFGVQVVENGKAHEVTVELGAFGKGRVEITGGALKEGMLVGVPSA
ncbi:peptidoglycan-binding protein [Streptomyces sp. BI20]|uniref:peptidoglycan-binding protein n=1 Tax=Streptomyces sp. BI20 TaxID=3403460 RepID=UPI003C77F3E7